MALNPAFKKVFSSAVQRELEKLAVIYPLVNRDYEGQIRGGGDTVSIPSIGAINVNSYTRGSDITFQEVDAGAQTLLIDQEKYAAFKVDDVDKIQAGEAGIEFMLKAAQEASYGLSDDMDSYIASLHSGIAASHTVSDTDVTSADILSNIALLNKMALDYNWPKSAPWNLVVGTATHHYMVLGSILTDTDNSELLARGSVGRVMNFNVFVSNNIKNDAGTFPNITEYNMAFLSSGITMAQQITEMESGRMEKQFGDYVKMLNVYGAKIVHSNRVLKLSLEFAPETAI